VLPAFQVHFGVLLIGNLGRLFYYYQQTRSQPAREIIQVGILAGILAFVFWLLDYHYCTFTKTLPYQTGVYFHGLWHFGMALHAFLGPVFMEYVIAERRKAHPIIKWTTGLPFVYIRKT
jgi:hypothetical protein